MGVCLLCGTNCILKIRLSNFTSDHVRFVVDKAAMGQIFLPVLRFSPVSIIPRMLHTQKYCSSGNQRALDRKVSFRFVSFRFVVLTRSTYLFTAGVKVVCFHLITRTHTPKTVGLLWTRDRPVADASTWQHKHSQETNIHATGGIRTHDPSKRSAANLRSFSGEGPRSRRYGRTAALRLIVQPYGEDEDDYYFLSFS
jgi:hypothetical protein